MVEARAPLKRITPPIDAPVGKLLDIGRLAMELQAPDVAEPFFSRAVEAAPDSPQVHEQLALAQVVRGRYQEASDRFKGVIGMNPRASDSLAGLAMCEASLGRSKDALAYAESALRIDSAQPLARQVIANLRRN